MANFDTIKTIIDANIKTNGTQGITGSKMNSILKQMVDVTDVEFTELKSGVQAQVDNYKPIVIHGDVTNAADEEDITSKDGLLKIKNRNNLNGMGYVILRKGLSFSEQLTLPNTIYEIRYDFDGGSEPISIPSNSVLKFDGGHLYNVSLVLGENVKIINGAIEIREGGKITLNNGTHIENCQFSCVSYCSPEQGVLFAENKENILIKNCFFGVQKRQELGKCSSIDLRNCKDFLIDGVISKETEGENIMVYEGTGVITNCQCYGGWSGIGTAVYGTSVDNEVESSENTLIIISNNIVHNAKAAGITLNNNNVLCTNNQVIFEDYRVNGPGIRLGHAHSKANDCYVGKNIIKWVNSTPTGVSTSNKGISVDAGNNNVVDGNIIINIPVGVGSSVVSKTGTIISNNTIKNCSEVGISIYETSGSNSYCSVRGNKIHMTGGEAISLFYSNAELLNNSISGEGEDVVGISLTTQEFHEINLIGNTVKCNKAFGEYIYGKVTATDNKFLSDSYISITGWGELVIKNNIFQNMRIFPAKISTIVNNIFKTKEGGIMYINTCESIVILGNVMEVPENSGYTMWWNVPNKDEIKSIVIGGNYYTGLSLIPSSLYNDAGDKVKGGYNYGVTSYAMSRFLSQKGEVNALGFSLYNPSGSTGTRPILTNNDIGAIFFDTILGKPIWYKGDNKWIDATGQEVA